MKQYPKPYTLNPIPLTYFNFQQVCSILPLIAARLLLLAVQWKWSLAKSNNFQVILRIFPTSKFSSWFNRSFISASLWHELSRIRRRAPFPRQRLPSVPDIQSFSPEWRIDCSSIVNQSFTRAVLDGLTSKADVVNFCLFFRCDGSVVSLSDWLPRALSINVQFFKSNTFPSSNWA